MCCDIFDCGNPCNPTATSQEAIREENYKQRAPSLLLPSPSPSLSPSPTPPSPSPTPCIVSLSSSSVGVNPSVPLFFTASSDCGEGRYVWSYEERFVFLCFCQKLRFIILMLIILFILSIYSQGYLLEVNLLMVVFFATEPTQRRDALVSTYTSHANNHHRLFLFIVIFIYNDSPSSCSPSSFIKIGGSIEVKPNALAFNTTVEIMVQFISVLILPSSFLLPSFPFSPPLPYHISLLLLSLFSLCQTSQNDPSASLTLSFPINEIPTFLTAWTNWDLTVVTMEVGIEYRVYIEYIESIWDI